jgi:electron transfer flavoprotein beta subunit
MGLNIIVCIKSVVIDAPDGKVVRVPEACELNSFDRPAIETALCLRDQTGGEVIALSMGPESAELALYEALSIGVDRAVLVTDSVLAGSDTLATSTTLGAAIKKLTPFDIVIFGARTSDSDTGQVGPQTATLLDLPLVTGVYNVEYQDPKLKVERKIDEFIEEYEISLPGVLTIHPSAVSPRDASLMGIESSFERGTISRMNISDLDLSSRDVGERGSPTKVISMRKVKKIRECSFIEGSIEEQADSLIRELKEAGFLG